MNSIGFRLWMSFCYFSIGAGLGFICWLCWSASVARGDFFLMVFPLLAVLFAGVSLFPERATP